MVFGGEARLWRTRFGVAGSAPPAPTQACNTCLDFVGDLHENQPRFKIHSHKNIRHNSVS
jgi:hypothetical protein